MNETTFENAEVNDRVWDIRYGYGVVVKALEPKNSHLFYRIFVKFPSLQEYETYTVDGFSRAGNAIRSLFWDELKFEVPTRPKKKRIVSGWIGISPAINSHCCDNIVSAYTSNIVSKKEALEVGRHEIIQEIEFEVDE